MAATDNLDAWPSDDRKFNVVEFYHKILWASQQCEQVVSTIKEKGCNRVTFSTEPPVIYEYEPEYSNTNKKTSFFNYQNFKSQQGDCYYYSQPLMNDYDDDNLLQNHRLMKTRSLSEFKPIPNQDFNTSSLAPCYQSSMDDDNDPPPSYIEYNVYSNIDSNLFESRFINNNLVNKKSVVKKESALWVGQAFFQRTLRKIKSTPRLMVIQRRSSMASLRKKKSFFH